jgi:hypothetical protein
MSRTDRVLRRTSHHLAAEEVLLGTAVGLEVDGRRRQVLLLTDQRVLRVGLRSEAPDELQLPGSRAAFDEVGGILTVSNAAGRLELRGVERAAAERIELLLGWHRSRLRSRATEGLRHVRIVPA